MPKPNLDENDMHRNPVKRDLVEAPELWRWSSFRATEMLLWWTSRPIYLILSIGYSFRQQLVTDRTAAKSYFERGALL